MRLVTGPRERGEHGVRGLSLGVRKVADAAGQALEEDVAVAHLAEDACDPAELVPQPLRPLAVEQRAKRAQIGAQATRGHASLVDAFRVGVEAHDRVVADQADHGERDRAPHDVARRCVRSQVGDGDLRRQRPGRSERADVLRGLVGRTRAGLAESFDERVEKTGRHLLADLDLELAERPGLLAVQDGDGVVDDAGEEPPAGVVQPRSAPDRRHLHALRELLAADEAGDEIDGGLGRVLAVPGEHDFGPDEERGVPFGGELDGPALPGAVPQARSPAREAEVGRVVVRRVVALGRRLANGRPDEAVDARHPEVGSRGELQLAFRTVLHSRLSVPASRRPARGGGPTAERAVPDPEESGARARATFSTRA